LAPTFTIPFGHTIDALCHVVGNFSHVASVVSTQAKQWLETDTQNIVDVTGPDNGLVSGRLACGGLRAYRGPSLGGQRLSHGGLWA
jgi:hypothetical protein